MFERWRETRIPYVGDHIPWEMPVSDSITGLADGGVVAVIALDGWPSETADVVDIISHHARRNTTIRNIAAADRLVLSSYVCRGLADPSCIPQPHPNAPAWAAGLASRYGAHLSANRLYDNRLFLAVHLRPPGAGAEWLDRRREQKASSERAADRIHRLRDICEWLVSELQAYGPRLLRSVQRGRQMCSEPAEAIAFAVTGVWRPVVVPTGRLGDSMLAEEIAFHHETIEMRGPGHTQFGAILAMQDYPAQVWPGLFDVLLAAPLRFTFVHHFEPLSQSAGMALITRKQNKMAWAGDKALSQAAELTTAADDLASGRMIMGRHTAALMVFAERSGGDRSAYRRVVDTLNEALRNAGLTGVARSSVAEDVADDLVGRPDADRLAEVINEAWKRMSGVGPTPARVNNSLMAGWKSFIPGNVRYRARPGACSSRNFSAMAPMHGFARGAERSRWGAPIAILRTSGGTPYRFHWHDGEGDDAVGNTLVTGETGSGKSVTIGMMMAMTAGRADIIALDHKRGWDVLVRHLGGAYAVLGAGNPMFAPLKALPHTDASLTFLFDLLRGCIVQGGWRDLTPDEDRMLALGIDTVMGNDPDDRRLAEVVAFLSPEADPEGAGARLRRWCWGEELGWVLDAPRCALDLSGAITGLDTTSLLENGRAAPPALLYLFYRIARRLDGRPLLLTVDEGWKTMEEPAFIGPISAQYRTIRSKGGVVVFITQSPADIHLSPAGAAVLQQCPNQMHFPNPRTSEADYVQGLKRTQGEYEALHKLHKGTGQFLLCKGSEALVAELPMSGLRHDLAVLSASEMSLRELDRIPDAVKADPQRLAPAYAAARHGADLLREEAKQ